MPPGRLGQRKCASRRTMDCKDEGAVSKAVPARKYGFSPVAIPLLGWPLFDLVLNDQPGKISWKQSQARS